MNYAVIGGGITGLASAYFLTKKGHKVTLFDSAGDGGLIQTQVKDGFTLELGAFTLVATPELKNLLNELSLDREITYPIIDPYKQYIWYKGKPLAVPRSFIQFLVTPLFSIQSKIKLIKQFFAPLSKTLIDGNKSIGEVFSTHFFPDLVSDVIDPVLRGIFGGDPWKLSFNLVFKNLSEELVRGGTFFTYFKSRKTIGRRKIFHIKGGNGKLISSLKNIIFPHVVKETVTDLIFEVDHYKVSTNLSKEYIFDGIYITTAGAATATYIKNISPSLQDKLQSIGYAGLVVVHLELDKDEKLLKDGFGILFPRDSGTDILGVLFNSQLFPDVALNNKKVITVCLGDKYLTENNSTIIAYIKSQLINLLNIRNPKELLVTKWDKAIPQYNTEHHEVIEIINKTEGRYPNLHFIGADIGGVGVPDRVKNALRAFESV